MPGIVDFEVRFPSARISTRQMQAASGIALSDITKITRCEQFPVLDDGEQAWELALDAARALLDRVYVPPKGIRHVIYAGSGVWDKPFWSPAAAVARKLGIRHAHCYEVSNFCNASMTAVMLGSDAIMQGRAPYVLVLLGDQLSRLVDYSDRMSKALFNFGDAAAAILMAEEGCAFEVLHSSMRTDPVWSDYYTGEHYEGRVVIRRGSHRKGLAEAYVQNFRALVHETLTALGRPLSDVAYLLINQSDEGMHRRLLGTLRLPPDRSVFNYHRLGHMGGADTLIALQDLVSSRRMLRGDLLLLATSAIGFSWGITAMEYTDEDPRYSPGAVPEDPVRSRA